MERNFSAEVRPLIDLVDQLRELGIEREKELSLPQIAVMGDQSSGKSSVLQSISGIPFPRGSGLVTRCPTQIIMTKTAPNTLWEAEAYLSWDHPQPPCAGKVKSVDALAPLIQELTNILTGGSENSFSTTSIVIRLRSPDAPDLTIIDLPGIVRTATNGQDARVISQVNELIESYIAKPNTIILAVIPANQDIATVDIIERATKVAASRTIGVLTKPDLIGPGSEDEVVQVLKNVKKPLELGYVMLKNSSQKQLNEGITIAAARADEINYFQKHEVFSKLPPKLFGMQNLVEKLTLFLVKFMKDTLPELNWKINTLLEDLQSEITKYGTRLPIDDRDKQTLVMNKISEYCKLLRLSSKGEYKENTLTYHPELRLHSQISQHYKDLQKQIGDMLPSNSKGSELIVRIENEIKTLRGRELPGFLSSQAFYCQVIRLVEDWKLPVDNCKNDVIESTLRVVSSLTEYLMSEYPNLRDTIRTMSTSLAESIGEEVTTKLESLLNREQDPYTSQDILLDVVNNIRFRNFDSALKHVLESADGKAMANNLEHLKADVKRKLGDWYLLRHGVDAKGNAMELTTLIQAYGDVSSRRLVDNICMCLEMDFLNRFIKDIEAQVFLYGVGLSQSSLNDLLTEDLDKSKMRESLQIRIDRLQKASDALRGIAPEMIAGNAGFATSHYNSHYNNTGEVSDDTNNNNKTTIAATIKATVKSIFE